MLEKYGLVGYPLSHSFSQNYFERKFLAEKINATYFLYELKEIEEIETLLKKEYPYLRGFNVTIPYKSSIMPFLGEIDGEAKQIGAVNTVVMSGETSIGFNTDGIGFEKSLKDFVPVRPAKALVLGAGGAAKAVAYTLNKWNVIPTFVSRRKGVDAIAYEDISEETLITHRLVVNCTPLGMYPNIEAFPPIPYHFLTPAHYLYDLIYNPGETQFLLKGRLQGAQGKNGLEMLHIQADASWSIWNQ